MKASWLGWAIRAAEHHKAIGRQSLEEALQATAQARQVHERAMTAQALGLMAWRATRADHLGALGWEAWHGEQLARLELCSSLAGEDLARREAAQHEAQDALIAAHARLRALERMSSKLDEEQACRVRQQEERAQRDLPSPLAARPARSKGHSA